MRSLLLTLLLVASVVSASAAITEKYVNAAGAGAHDGSDAANAFSWAEMITDINAGGKAGNRYNYTGNISRTTTADSVTSGGTTNSPVIIRGYASTIGDGYLGRTNGNNGLIPDNMPVLTYTTGGLAVSGTNIVIESLSFVGARSTAFVTVSGNNDVVRGCKFDNAASGTSGTALTLNTAASLLVAQDCDVILSNGGNAGFAAMNIGASNFRVIGCRVTSSNIGIQSTVAGTFYGNQIYNCSAVGLTNNSAAGVLTIIGNTIVGGSADGVGVLATGNTAVTLLVNNCITDNAGYGVNLNAAIAFVSNNRTRDNTLGAFNTSTDWVAVESWGQVTTDTGGPDTDYVNASITDYRLISTSPAKAAGVLPYVDIGALQRQESTGGGSWTFGN